MKKTYMMPVVRNLNTYEEEMIAASVDGFDPNLSSSSIDGSEMLSRESTIWDDEE